MPPSSLILPSGHASTAAPPDRAPVKGPDRLHTHRRVKKNHNKEKTKWLRGSLKIRIVTRAAACLSQVLMATVDVSHSDTFFSERQRRRTAKWLHLIQISFPVRPSASRSVQRCYSAGILVYCSIRFCIHDSSTTVLYRRKSPCFASMPDT